MGFVSECFSNIENAAEVFRGICTFAADLSRECLYVTKNERVLIRRQKECLSECLYCVSRDMREC